MKNILIIGGTRNMGHSLALRLLAEGHRITVLNRGVSNDELPDSVFRLRADRSNPLQMRRALLAKSFDVVVDFVVYRGTQAETVLELFKDNIGQYIFISTGQVYLVRQNLQRPFHESDYAGPLIPEPEQNTYGHEEWRYGMEKREAEDLFANAFANDNFPYTSLRLPMVNSERDPFYRLMQYILRIKDGGPVLVPDAPDYPLRHIYGEDVVNVISDLIASGKGIGRAYNISQDETVTIDEFLALVGSFIGMSPKIIRFPRHELEANGFLPNCSPFSDVWMSELDNSLSKTELGVQYTPLEEYLETLVRHYLDSKIKTIPGYKRRSAELQMVAMVDR